MLARLMRGTGANAFGQMVIAGLQLFMVPVLATHWGLDRYGIWLLLWTIPSYLALGDFGFATAAGNDMTMRVARGDRAGAIVAFQSASAAIAGFSSIVLVIALGIIWWLPTALITVTAPISPQEIRVTLALLAVYGIASLQSSIFLSGFPCAGLYALGVMTQALIMLVEGVAAICVVLLGGSLWAVAATYLFWRVLGILAMALVLRWRVGWLEFGFRRANRQEAERLFVPAISVLAIPLSQAMFLQGTVLAIGAALSSGAVTIFVTVRTITRVAVQIATLMNRAIMPEFAVAEAKGARNDGAKIVLVTVLASALVLIIICPTIALFGTQIIEKWTSGVVHPPKYFLGLMVLTAALNCFWFPLSNLILSINRHSSYSFVFLITSIITAAATYPLSTRYGLDGAAMALIALESVMLLHVIRLLPKVLVNGYEIRQAAVSIANRLRMQAKY